MPTHNTTLLLAASTSTSTVAVCLLYLQHLCLHPPLVHSIVHYGVDAAVGHRKPVEDEVHVLGVPEDNDDDYNDDYNDDGYQALMMPGW